MNSVGEFQSARDYLNDSARFGGLLEGYRPREAQLRMADAVASASSAHITLRNVAAISCA